MKPSELKVGDHYKLVGDQYPIIFRVEPAANKWSSRHIALTSGKQGGSTMLAGQVCASCDDDVDVELVPMPHTKEFPYVVGRAYRTRGGARAVYCGADRPNSAYPAFRHEFSPGVSAPFCTIDDAGRWAIHGGDSRGDIMGEWREREPEAKSEPAPEGVELIAGHTYRRRNGGIGVLSRRPTQADARVGRCLAGPQEVYFLGGGMYWYAGGRRGLPGIFAPGDQPDHELVEDMTITNNPNNPKEGTPVSKRTLPTVTLDQIFNTLRDKDACWYRELGPLKLAKKLEMLSRNTLGVIEDEEITRVSLRTLHHAVQVGAINVSEANWLSNAADLRPTDCDGMIGAPEFEKALDEWENPKPKIRLLSSYPKGTTFKHHGNRCKIVDMDYGGDMAGMKTRGLVFMTYGHDLCVSFMAGITPMNGNGITDIVEPA